MRMFNARFKPKNLLLQLKKGDKICIFKSVLAI